MRSVTIDECTEGYLVKEGGTFKTYAVSKDKLIQKVKELLGITDKSKAVTLGGTKIEQIKSNPELFIKSLDMRSGSAIAKELEPAINQSKILPVPAPPPFVFSEIAAFEVSVQPITNGKSIYWLHPGGKKIKISREGYQSAFIYANISDLVYLYEHPSEASSILKAYGTATYDNKAVVLRGFLKDVPLSALVGDNHNDEEVSQKGGLMELLESSEPKGQEDGSCDDVAFESCANNTPEQCKYCIDQSRYENKNKNKLAAKKPAPPLMKSSVPP